MALGRLSFYGEICDDKILTGSVRRLHLLVSSAGHKELLHKLILSFQSIDLKCFAVQSSLPAYYETEEACEGDVCCQWEEVLWLLGDRTVTPTDWRFCESNESQSPPLDM